MSIEKEPVSTEKGRLPYFIGLLISFLITGVMCALIMLSRYSMVKDEISSNPNYVWTLIWADGLNISSLLMVAFYILTLLTKEGAFDAIAYSVQLVWVNMFHKSTRNTRLAKNYAEYREEKKRSRDRNLSFLVLGATPYILAGIVVLVINILIGYTDIL